MKFGNGDVMPRIGLGTWLSNKNEVYDAVIEAIRLGYRHIDCAYIYGNEPEIGKALKYAMDSGLVSRKELFITSKLWNSDHEPGRVEIAIRRTLTALQLDYLDLYLIHWPVAFKAGHEQVNRAADLLSLDEMPLSATWQGMQEVKRLNLAKHIGVSNFNIPKLSQLMADAEMKPEVNQIELHPYFQQPELLRFCQDNDILVTAYSPLGSRHLIKGDDSITNNETVVGIARKHACLPAQVLLAWGMKRSTSVIPKSVNLQRIQENFESIHVELDDLDMAELARIDRNERMTRGMFCVLPGGFYTFENIWDL